MNGILISVNEYVNLSMAAETLGRLHVGGVDNWEGYGESLYPDGEPDFDEAKALIEAKAKAIEKDYQLPE